MSGQKLIRTVSEELSYINERIDMKIIKGLPYKKEARRHKLLMSMLKSAQSQHQTHSSFSFLSYR